VVEALARSSFLTGGPMNGVLVLGVATVALTLPLAALSYYVVERPMLRFKDPGRARRG
jgi:peptidoglycan/LPS O-acetylase OafA/YrhL